MSKPIFKSNQAAVLRKNDDMKDFVLGRMAMDVEVGIKTTAGTPVKTGAMKADTRHFRAASGKFRVEMGKEYSAVQEAGVRGGSAAFRNYTTPGTSAGFFKRAVDGVQRRSKVYFDEAKVALGL